MLHRIKYNFLFWAMSGNTILLCIQCVLNAKSLLIPIEKYLVEHTKLVHVPL